MVSKVGGIYYPKVFLSFAYLCEDAEYAVVGECTLVRFMSDKWGCDESDARESIDFLVAAGIFMRDRGGIRLTDELRSCLCLPSPWTVLEKRIQEMLEVWIEKSFASLNSANIASVSVNPNPPPPVHADQLISWVADNCVGLTIREMAEKASEQFGVPVEIATCWICQMWPKLESTARK